ncbi:hypothetical protein ACQR36_30170, partial [Rhodococcus erythropolis]|uniref:hypothetical protein n=1 Tax=Rhodococcus erythropolis TaxID=1833 RepID=UPI003D0EF123
ALYRLNQYLLSDFGIIFLGVISLIVGISLLSPMIWRKIGNRLVESGLAVKQEWLDQKRVRKEKPKPPRSRKPVPVQAQPVDETTEFSEADGEA